MKKTQKQTKKQKIKLPFHVLKKITQKQRGQEQLEIYVTPFKKLEED